VIRTKCHVNNIHTISCHDQEWSTNSRKNITVKMQVTFYNRIHPHILSLFSSYAEQYIGLYFQCKNVTHSYLVCDLDNSSSTTKPVCRVSGTLCVLVWSFSTIFVPIFKICIFRQNRSILTQNWVTFTFQLFKIWTILYVPIPFFLGFSFLSIQCQLSKRPLLYLDWNEADLFRVFQ
jgi:hypothetical protein